MKPVSSILKRLAWAAGILIVFVLTAHILLPFIVNTSELRHRILSQANKRVGGEVDFQALSVVLLPIPHAVVTQGRIELPGAYGVHFAEGVLYPRFWPLLTGRVKVDRLKIIEPEIIIPVTSDRVFARQPTQGHPLEEMDRWIRGALTRAAGVLGPSALRIKGGRLTFTRASQPPVTFSQIRIKASVSDKMLSLSASGRSNLANTFEIEGEFAFDNLNGRGRIEFTGFDTARLASMGLIPPKAPVAVKDADLTLGFEIRGVEDISCEYQVQMSQLAVSRGARRLTIRDLMLKGEGRRTPEKLQLSLVRLQTEAHGVQLSATASWPGAGRFSWTPAELMLKAVDLDVDPIRTAALNLAGDERGVRHLFEIIQGGRIPALDIRISGIGKEASNSGVNVDIYGRISEGRIVLPHDLLHLDQVAGRVEMSKGRLSAEDVSARLGNSFARGGTLVLGLFDGTRDFSLDAAIDADLSEVPAVLKQLLNGRQAVPLLDRIPPVKGRAAGRLRLGGRLDQISVKVSTSGRMEALDAALDLSGNIDVLPATGPDYSLSFHGVLGPRIVAWLYAQWGLPTEFMLRAPITVNKARIAQNRVRGWGVEGRFSLPNALKVTAGLQIGPNEDLSCKLHLRDSDSDAVIDYQLSRADGRLVGFAGKLEKSTVDRLLQDNALILGRLQGEMRVRLQDDQPAHSAVQGRLDFQQINMPSGFPIPLHLLSGQVAGNGNGFELSPVVLKWGNNTARLSGKGSFTENTVGLDLDLDADTLDVDKLTRRVSLVKKTPGPRTPGRNPVPSIRGRVRIHAGQMALKGYHIAPLQAVATLGDEYVSVDLIDAGLCGISLPGQIRFNPEGVQLLLKPHAAGAALRDTDQCLAGTAAITERLEGTVNVHGRIESSGQSNDELVRNLKGGLDVQIDNGRMYNIGAAGFFTNLLAFISVHQLIDGEMPDLRRNDFKYKNLTSKLSFQEGIMHIEEGVLKSNAFNIVASGDYHLIDKEMNLVLLVSPLTTMDWIIERIPLVGNILQGTLVAVPVGVKGPAANPSVVPLSPKAVGSRLGGILKRTINTPFRILSPLLKDKPSKDQTDQGSK